MVQVAVNKVLEAEMLYAGQVTEMRNDNFNDSKAS